MLKNSLNKMKVIIHLVEWNNHVESDMLKILKDSATDDA